jgi:hypothetical protein
LSRRDFTLSWGQAYLFALALGGLEGLLLSAASRRFWGATWSRDALGVSGHDWIFWLAFLIGIFGHELLHGVGFLLGGVPPKRIRFGIKAIPPAVYCTTDARMEARHYRIAGLLPGVLLGILPTLFGLFTRSSAILTWGFLMVVSCGGDLAALWEMRSIPSSVLVEDSPDGVGCRLAEAKQQIPGPSK